MGTRVEGEVWGVYDKRWGQTTLWSVKLDGDDNFYRLGRDRHEGVLEKGNYVSFEYSEDKKGQLIVDPKTVQEADRPKPAPGTAAPAGDRQQSITYQSSRKDAIEVLNFMVENDLVDLGKKTGKGAQEARRAVYLGLLDQYTAGFYEDVFTLGGLDRANESASGGANEEEAGIPADAYDD